MATLAVRIPACLIRRAAPANGDMAILQPQSVLTARHGVEPADNMFGRYVRYSTEGRLLLNYCSSIPGCVFAKKGCHGKRVDELRAELNRLLKKQTEVLESRTLGAADDTEILEYEIRREVIQEICNQLANSISV